MRARLIEAALADGHTVIGRARRDLALYAVPRPPRRRRRGRPRKYGPRMTRARIEALPVHRSARVLYGRLEVVRYRTRRVAARFLKGRVVRAVWPEFDRAWAHGEIHVNCQWLRIRRSCAHSYTCMPMRDELHGAVSVCNEAQRMPTDRKLGPGHPRAR